MTRGALDSTGKELQLFSRGSSDVVNIMAVDTCSRSGTSLCLVYPLNTDRVVVT
ncbi:MAG: hypothetical protein ABW092_13270 [Candidatus Thiodiazotropha sp.]